MVLQPLLEDEQRIKCGGVVDGPYVSYLTVNSSKEQCQNKHQIRDRSLILIISTSFGESLISGDHVCIRRETMLKWRQKYISEHATQAWELEGPHPEANQLKTKRKYTSDKTRSRNKDPKAKWQV